MTKEPGLEPMVAERVFLIPRPILLKHINFLIQNTVHFKRISGYFFGAKTTLYGPLPKMMKDCIVTIEQATNSILWTQKSEGLFQLQKMKKGICGWETLQNCF